MSGVAGLRPGHTMRQPADQVARQDRKAMTSTFGHGTVYPLGSGLGDIVLPSVGQPAVRAGTGEFLRLQNLPAELPSTLVSGVSQGDAAKGYLETLERELRRRLEQSKAERWNPLRHNICVLGASALAEEFREVLREMGAKISPSGEANLLLAIEDGPALTTQWAAYDNAVSQDVNWLCAYREGQLLFVDPLKVEPEDADHSQVVRRRQAASPAVLELSTWWQNVEASSTPRPSMAVPGAAKHLLFARLLNILQAWTSNTAELVDYRRTLWRLEFESYRVTEHIVLGFPEPRPLPR